MAVQFYMKKLQNAPSYRLSEYIIGTTPDNASDTPLLSITENNIYDLQEYGRFNTQQFIEKMERLCHFYENLILLNIEICEKCIINSVHFIKNENYPYELNDASETKESSLACIAQTILDLFKFPNRQNFDAYIDALMTYAYQYIEEVNGLIASMNSVEIG